MATKPESEFKTFSTGNKWSVGCKKHAIPAEVAGIALKYCNGDRKNVSKGIREMEAVIQKQKKEIDDMGAWIEERI